MAKRRKSRRSKPKVSLAQLVGLIVGLAPGVSYAWSQASDTSQGGTFWSRLGWGGLYAFAGLTHDSSGKMVFVKDGLMIGTVPLIAGLGLGYGIHKAAAKLGVNRQLKSIPWVQI